MTEKFLRMADVMSVTGLRRSTIYERMKKGRFPKQNKLEGRAVGWPLSKVEAWVEKCKSN